MIYTDNIHLCADTVDELHQFAYKIGLKRCWFHGVRKGHPHYDLHGSFNKIVIEQGALLVNTRNLIKLLKKEFPKEQE